MPDSTDADELTRLLTACETARSRIVTTDDNDLVALRADIEEYERQIRAELGRLHGVSVDRSDHPQ